MVSGFTPLDIEKIKNEKNNLNTILLLIVTLTMAILVVILFILIQKKIHEQQSAMIEPTPTIEIQPTETPTPILSPTLFQETPTSVPEASETPVLSITPATESSQIKP